MSVNPPMASGYGPSVTAPSVATMLAGRFSSPPADTYTPALMAFWTTACAPGLAGRVLAGDVVHRVGTERDQVLR
jgi:hypothetical protein